MTSVFISYSRTDQPFVRKLFDALAAVGRDAWVDWEGIPPGAEWLREIYGAIDSADTFVFILSPDSVASEVCGMEVTHALENRKRLIVIACRSLAFSPDGKTLATMNSGGIVTLWNLATGAAGDHFTVGTTPYTVDFRLTFSPDGTLLAATDSQTLTIWDVRNHQPFVRPIFDSVGIQSISFSPDGSLLDESQLFGADILRATTVSAWEAQACAIANRNLTQAEWTQFIGTALYQKTCPDQPAGA